MVERTFPCVRVAPSAASAAPAGQKVQPFTQGVGTVCIRDGGGGSGGMGGRGHSSRHQ
eukprot:SAG31_NODE_324_length_17691_cov_8.128126_7_plen_58_part_00